MTKRPGLLPAVAAGLLLVQGLPLAAATGDGADPALSDLRPLNELSVDTSRPARAKYAIVIGNSDYASTRDLKNATADADSVAEFLRRQGYDVRHYSNVGKRGFEDILRRVLFDIGPETEVVFYFAGHGLQIGAENFLVPVDANLDSPDDVPFEAVSLGSLVSILGSRARLQVVILDSCRNNPFAGAKLLTQVGGELRETETGFASQAAPVNSIVVFSTSPGQVALDGDGANSPFTSAFLEVAGTQPDAQATDTFEAVRRLVYARTKGRQVPWDSSTLIEPVTFGTAVADLQLASASAPEGGASATREVTPAVASLAEAASEGASGADFHLAAPLEREVKLGAALAKALGISGESRISISGQPGIGRLMLDDGKGFRRSATGIDLDAGAIGDLTLLTEIVERPAMSFEGPAVTGQFTVTVDGALRSVEVSLTPDPCDLAAGDQLDPDGVGFARFANEIDPEAAVAACEAAVAAMPSNGRFHYQLGRAYTAARQFDAARASFEKARDLGHTRAWYALGTAVINEARQTGGAVRERAPDEALAFFMQGVQEGDPYAYYALGRQFLRYGNDDRLELRGYDLMMRALEVGHTFAMNELGYFYLDSEGKYYDPQRGLRYLRESAARGDIYGYNNLGLVYLDGMGGIEKNPKEAYDWFVKAAEGGHPNAPGNIGQLLATTGLNGKPDLPEAIVWFDRGLERGDASAGAYAAYLLATERIAGYGPADAALRAGKTAALSNEKARQNARDILASLPVAAVDEASQTIIAALGEPVEVDGAFGQGSRDAQARVLAKFGVTDPATDPIERLVQLARAQWTTSPFRVDLY